MAREQLESILEIIGGVLTGIVAGIVLVIFTIGFSQANYEAAEVVGAKYKAETDSILVVVRHNGGKCEGNQLSMRIRGCTDLFFPYKCFADVQLSTSGKCQGDSFTHAEYSLESLGLKSKKFRKATVVLRGTKSELSVELPY